jgi:hypothetical protein
MKIEQCVTTWLDQPFDPHNIMNPGGKLGLYIGPAQRENA